MIKKETKDLTLLDMIPGAFCPSCRDFETFLSITPQMTEYLKRPASSGKLAYCHLAIRSDLKKDCNSLYDPAHKAVSGFLYKKNKKMYFFHANGQEELDFSPDYLWYAILKDQGE